MLNRLKITIVLISSLVVAYAFVGGLINKVSAGEEDVYLDLSIFTQVLNHIQRDYVEEPDLTRAMYGALHGMIEALDPYSSFVDQEIWQELSVGKEEFASVGLTLSKRYSLGYIVAVEPGSPAEEDGLRTGDLIEAIDNHLLPTMSLWEAEKRLQGAENTHVDLRLQRARAADPSQLSLRRVQISPSPIKVQVLEEGIGLVTVPRFVSGTEEVLQAKLKTLLSSNIRGLVVDLRGSAVGELEEAVKISDLFLRKGLKVVGLKDNQGETVDRWSYNDPLVSDVEVVLLVDGGTSGAAEVFAAALKDNGVAELIGQRTDGRGSEQDPFPLEDGSMLILSKRTYLRPSGELLQRRALRQSGLRPEVRSPESEFVANFYYEHGSKNLNADQGSDFYRRLNQAIWNQQLQTAIAHIRGQISRKAA